MHSKSVINIVTMQTEIMLEGLLWMDAHLFLSTAKRCQLLIPKWPCQNKFFIYFLYLFIFFLGTFRVSTLGCCKYILFFFEFEIRTKPYANYKTDILEWSGHIQHISSTSYWRICSSRWWEMECLMAMLCQGQGLYLTLWGWAGVGSGGQRQS